MVNSKDLYRELRDYCLRTSGLWYDSNRCRKTENCDMYDQSQLSVVKSRVKSMQSLYQKWLFSSKINYTMTGIQPGSPLSFPNVCSASYVAALSFYFLVSTMLLNMLRRAYKHGALKKTQLNVWFVGLEMAENFRIRTVPFKSRFITTKVVALLWNQSFRYQVINRLISKGSSPNTENPRH